MPYERNRHGRTINPATEDGVLQDILQALGGGTGGTVVPVEIVKTVPSSGTAVKLSATTLLVKTFGVMAKKITGANSGKIYLGMSTVNASSHQIIELSANDYFEWPVVSGAVIDLANIYIDASVNDDGVVGFYIPAE